MSTNSTNPTNSNKPSGSSSSSGQSPASAGQPNVLVILADQLTCAALESFGGQYGCAPNIDKLAQRGVRFTRTYTHTPLCQPARAAMWTGLYPHQTGVMSNGGPNHPYHEKPIDPALPTLGKLFSAAGYRAIHFGKTHDMGALAGFEIINPKGHEELPADPSYPMNMDSFRDVFTTQKTCEFLQSFDASENTPFIAAVDLLNPHNICQWVGENKDERNQTLTPEQDASLPPLPDNFRPDDFDARPLPVRYLCCAHRRQGQSAHWSNATWRRYIDAYQYYTRMVDKQIGQILAALNKRSDAANTVILFTADHGDGLTSHKIATKHTAFYENITRIPLILCTPDQPQTGQANDSLASLIDVLPTLCTAAGIDTPSTCPGQSLQNTQANTQADDQRKFVVCQWFTEWGQTISPGRMVRSDRYKYTHYLEGVTPDGSEELYDLLNDPGETRTLHNDLKYTQVLSEHRAMLQEHVAQTNDPYFSLDLFVPQEFRAHPCGYEHHTEATAEL